MKPAEFRALVAEMRKAQKTFFAAFKALGAPGLSPAQKGDLESKKRASLADSRRLEDAVDKEIKAQEQAERQPSLFGEGES